MADVTWTIKAVEQVEQIGSFIEKRDQRYAVLPPGLLIRAARSGVRA